MGLSNGGEEILPCWKLVLYWDELLTFIVYDPTKCKPLCTRPPVFLSKTGGLVHIFYQFIREYYIAVTSITTLPHNECLGLICSVLFMIEISALSAVNLFV